jgi:hypothetical protein
MRTNKGQTSKYDDFVQQITLKPGTYASDGNNLFMLHQQHEQHEEHACGLPHLAAEQQPDMVARHNLCPTPGL